MTGPVTNVIVCAAHSDDCVIMASEYTNLATKQGFEARIVYLTCSGTDPESNIAVMRKAEAKKAWQTIGIRPDNLHFIGLSESPVQGPINYSPAEIQTAVNTLKNVIATMPSGTAIIIPADHEDHVDHQTMREVALNAAQQTDLLIYETPEYNNHLSLIMCPEKTIRIVLRHIPLLSRLVRPYDGPTAFTTRGGGCELRGSIANDLLSTKLKLLEHFKSQNGELLKRLFGYRSRYRKISTSTESTTPNVKFKAFGGSCDYSVLALFAGLLIGIHVTIFSIGNTFLSLPVFSSPLFQIAPFAIGIAINIGYLIRCLNKKIPIETLIIAFTAGTSLALFSMAQL